MRHVSGDKIVTLILYINIVCATFLFSVNDVETNGRTRCAHAQRWSGAWVDYDGTAPGVAGIPQR